MTTATPRIAFVIPNLSLGGAERSLVKLANGLTRNSFDVHLVIFGRPEPSLENELDRTIGTVFLGGDSSWSPRLWVQLVRTLRRIRPDLVFGWSLFANLAVTWLQPFHGCRRVIVSERNYLPEMARELPRWRWRLLQTLMRWCYRRARYVTANSAPSVEAVRGWVGPGPEYVVIPNMIQVDAARASADLPAPGMPVSVRDRLCILALGRLVFQKGFDVLLSAFAEVRRVRDWDLVIVGQGELEAQLKQQAATLGLSDRVHWLGRQPVPFPYYQAADLVVVPSRFEGIPNVLLEAMALGRPTISADCMTGPRILTENGRFGVLVPVEDSAALAAAIVEVGDDAERRAELGRRAGEHIARTYDEPIVLADITALLRTALQCA
jgi:glycosyltransferase involved in cell wall biosynthesis